MSLARLSTVAIGAFVLAGCVSDPKQYETVPVTVNSAKGPVLCQLYSPKTVTWDRAIDRPQGMSVVEADQVCRTEGYRIINEAKKK